VNSGVAGHRPPTLRAPRLDDILGRRAPDLSLRRMSRVYDDAVPPLEPRNAARTALRDHLSAVGPGDSVAIGVGSRGINQISEVVAGMIEALQERGAKPFIVPAMGSHGGASPRASPRNATPMAAAIAMAATIAVSAPAQTA